jgi:hypothetical protein
MSAPALREWLWSHLFAEVASLMVAIASVTAAAFVTTNPFLLVAASVCGSSLCYYTIVFTGAMAQEQRMLQLQAVEKSRAPLCRTLRSLLLDYGSVEALDAFLFSPLLLYTFLHLLPNHQMAVAVSEIVGIVIFYLTLYGIRLTRRAGR